MYREPIPSQNPPALSYEDYITIRDPILGWPHPSEFGGAKYDLTGSRWIPSFENSQESVSCVSLYGDSFTFSAEVDHEQAWSNLLSELLGCRVANYGVGSYGLDQAYLRFIHNGADESRVVILGYLSDNIARNLTRTRDLQTGNLAFGLKPRFILDSQGELELVPIPQLSESEFRRLVGLESPQLLLEYENFYPGGPSGASKFQFPYTYSLIRNLSYFRMRAKLAGRPPYMEFYEYSHPLNGLQITREIVRAFVRDANRAGRTPIVLVFAGKSDLIFHRRTGLWSYQNILGELDRTGIGYLDFGPLIIDYLGDRDLDEFFTPGGHYNEEGNTMVANFLGEHLRVKKSQEYDQ